MAFSALFGTAPPKVEPKEAVRQWTRELRTQKRGLDREVRKIEREEAKVKQALKQGAKAGKSKHSCLILAKSLVKSKKARERILVTQTQLGSVELALKQSLASMKVAGVMQSSAQVMKSMNALVKMKELREVSLAMSKEMMKAGLIEEMVEEVFEDDEVEEEAEEEVEKVLYEITEGQLGSLTEASRKLKTEGKESQKDKEKAMAAELAELEAMNARLSQLE
eukprot:g4765.t1